MPLLRRIAIASLIAFTVAGPAARSQSLDPGVVENELAAVEIHGFVSQGFIWTSENDYLTDSDRGSFEFTDVGINFTRRPTDRLRIGMQLFARDLGPIGDYSAKVDWLYLDYAWRDWLGFRAGRVKLPFGLYNDTSDVDAARTPILLPQSIYPLQNRDYLLAQTGVEAYGWRDLGAAGALDYRLYLGTIFLESERDAGAPLVVERLGVPYVVGGRLMWEAPVDGLRVGGSLQALRLEADLTVGSMPVALEVPAVLTVGSLEYVVEDLLLALEYSRWFVEIESSDPDLVPATPTVTSERAYVMATYRWSELLQTGAYYSALFPDVDDRTGRANRQHDIAATLRFDIDPHWMIKLEGHSMHGTAGLASALNGGRPLTELARHWAVFLAKATASF